MSSEQGKDWDVRARLKVLHGPSVGQMFIFRRARVTIGRDKKCSIPIDDPHLSRLHCVVERVSNHFTISDQESGSGTRINGRKVRSQVLRHKDVIELGESRIRFTQRLVKVEPPSPQAAEMK